MFFVQVMVSQQQGNLLFRNCIPENTEAQLDNCRVVQWNAHGILLSPLLPYSLRIEKYINQLL